MAKHKFNLDFLKNPPTFTAHSVTNNYFIIMNEVNYSRHRLFRVPLNINSKEMRLIYKIIKPNIILICLLERKHDYKDLKKYLKNL